MVSRKACSRSGRNSAVYKKLLRRRVEAGEMYGGSTPTVNELIDFLRVKYPEYCRVAREQFSRDVEQAQESSNKYNNKGYKRNLTASASDNDHRSLDSDSGHDIASPSRKKAKKAQGSRFELQSKSLEHDIDEETRAVLTSEDEVSNQTNIMLRKRYSRRKASEKPDNNVEVELVTDRERKTDESVKPYRVHKTKSLCNGPRLKDIGGLDDLLDELKQEVLLPLIDPELHHILGTSPPAGILLHGPPGCGKTRLARAMANETGVPFYNVAATNLVSGVSGASEENIRELFLKAQETAPSIVFIDEIDAIAPKRENHQRGMETRIVTQLLTCMDSKNREMPDGKLGHVLVIGSTNRPDALDPAFRRPGRFDREISLDVPDKNNRLNILHVITRDVKFNGDIDLVKFSNSTPGFVGADLVGLVDKAGAVALRRANGERKLKSTDSEQDEDHWKTTWTREEKDNLSIIASDMEVANKAIQPSTKREGFSSIPNVKWEDIGGHDKLRKKFNEHIVRRIKYPDEYEDGEDRYETGFLLYGPPGGGKTMIAQAVANEAGANFIHIHGPEILNKYVGESESKVRTIFRHARTCAPCIIFFDEIDALCKEREKEAGRVVNGVLTQLLTELDGGDPRKGVYVIGATNRRDLMDEAILRPGRLGEHMYVSLPNEDQRVSILKVVSRKMQLDADVDLYAIARSEACANLNGAHLAKLMRIASRIAHQEKMNEIEVADHERTSDKPSQSSLRGKQPYTIKDVHIKEALEKIKPSDEAFCEYSQYSRPLSVEALMRDHLNKVHDLHSTMLSMIGNNTKTKKDDIGTTIPQVIDIMNRIVENSDMIVGEDIWCHAMVMFRDPDNREVFFNMPSDDGRLSWLKFAHSKDIV